MRIQRPEYLLALAVATGCRQAPKQTMSPLISLRLDDIHNNAAGTNGQSYVIEPCEGIALDTTGYSIPIPPRLGATAPNAVHVIHKDNEYFRIGWDGRSSVTLSAQSLKNVRGNMAFSGFQLGESYIIGIGRDNFPDTTLKFDVMWVGLIKVEK
jgi:hypothetical protein